MLNQFERIELDVIDGALASVRRHPRGAYSRGGEFQYSCKRCLWWHFRIVTHFLLQTVVS